MKKHAVKTMHAAMNAVGFTISSQNSVVRSRSTSLRVGAASENEALGCRFSRRTSDLKS